MGTSRCCVAATLALAWLGGLPTIARGQAANPRREFHVTRTPRPPVIDGHLTEEAWAAADVLSEFTQVDPDEGKPATERTEIRLLYDDAALYVGARLFDRDAPRISRRLSTRDGDADADRLTIYLDPMHDRLTGVMFQVRPRTSRPTASSTTTPGMTWSWDAVWQSRVTADAEGWTVEMRIPLSQLRFPSADRQTWGINVARFIRRKNENVWLRDDAKERKPAGLPHGRTYWLRWLEAHRGDLELLPYMAGRGEFIAAAASRPIPSTMGRASSDPPVST